MIGSTGFGGCILLVGWLCSGWLIGSKRLIGSSCWLFVGCWLVSCSYWLVGCCGLVGCSSRFVVVVGCLVDCTGLAICIG